MGVAAELLQQAGLVQPAPLARLLGLRLRFQLPNVDKKQVTSAIVIRGRHRTKILGLQP